MHKASSWEVAPDLFLVSHPLPSVIAAPPPKAEPTHYVLVCDLSGSMSWEIPDMKAHIKSQLPSMVGENDTVSLIWYSGKNEFGPIFEGRHLRDHKDLIEANRLIDQWFRPVGLTAFVQPIQEAGEVAKRLLAKQPGRVALIFMSDGCDNCWPKDAIIAAVEKVAPLLASATVVEYGPYADRPVLTKMAEKWGGSVMYAANFSAYRPVFEAAIRRQPPAPKKTSLVLDAMPVWDFAFAIDGDNLLTFGADIMPTGHGGGVAVPSHLREVYYLSPVAVGKSQKLAKLAETSGVNGTREAGFLAAYAAMGLFARRVQPKTVWALLRSIGDVAFIDDFVNAIGKDRLTSFVEKCDAVALAGAPAFTKGWDPKKVPREDAPTILDIFALLHGDDRCRILTESDGFSYDRIGRKAISKADMLTVGEGEEVVSLAEEIAKLGPAREVAPLKDAMEKLRKILLDRKQPLRFHLDKEAAAEGYQVDDMTWKEGMPNLSFRVKRPGHIDLSEATDLPLDLRKKLPSTIQTYTYKQYAAVKDGFRHIDWLPVRVPLVVLDAFRALGVVTETDAVTEVGDLFQVTLDMRPHPVVNMKMVKEVSAKDFAEKNWALLLNKAAAAVFNYYKPERTSTGFATVYGADAAKWLDEHGVTDHSGFKRDDTSAPPVDFFFAKELSVNIPGFSSLPSVEDVRERMENEKKIAKDPSLGKGKGKLKALTPSGRLLVPYIEEVDAFLASDAYTKAANKDALFAKWATDKAIAATSEGRKLRREISKTGFIITVGGGWFTEFSSLAETKLTVRLGGEDREVTFELDTEKKIKI